MVKVLVVYYKLQEDVSNCYQVCGQKYACTLGLLLPCVNSITCHIIPSSLHSRLGRKKCIGRKFVSLYIRLYFCATFAWFLGLFWHFEICFLSTLRQMPQTITPCCLPKILTVPEFCCHLAHIHFHVKMSLLTLRGLFERLRAPSQSQKGHFSEKTKLKK